MNVDAKKKRGQWKVKPRAVISWYEIKDITSHFDIQINKSVSIHKQVHVVLRDGTIYSIDADMYNVLFLERKLKAFWQQFNKKTLT